MRLRGAKWARVVRKRCELLQASLRKLISTQLRMLLRKLLWKILWNLQINLPERCRWLLLRRGGTRQLEGCT